MKELILSSVLLCATSGAAFAASAPTSATIITKEDIQKVARGPESIDHNIRVIDMGQNYQMSVGVVHRGSTDSPNPSPAAKAFAARAATLPSCGLASVPPGAKVGPGSMLAHESTAETFYIVSGSGTLVTGGQILQGKQYPADNLIVSTINGPTCGGKVTGDFVSTPMKAGDMAVIPAGVPHGWSNIPTEITYVSIRPDPNHVLPKAPFVYPGLITK